jgi:sugar lactone lactonase YvrE
MERLASGFRLVEGPTVDPNGDLVFSDVQGGGVKRLRADGSVDEVIPHRRGIGGIAVHADGGLVVSGRNVAWKRPDGGSIVLLDREHDGMSFNDLTTDPEGRIYVGSLLFNPLDDGSSPRQAGDLYLIDLDGSTRVVHGDVSLTNGLGVSPDGTTLYHSDTDAHAVWRYDRAADGSVSNRRPLYHHDRADPDGLAVAADGSVWVAMAGSGEVVGVDADGTVRETIAVEVPMVTSVCFGGVGLADLFIVTGDRGAPADVGAAIYRMPAPTPGLPVAPARVRPQD